MRADKIQTTTAFGSKALTKVVKVLFEGQARKLPAIICLKKIFPEELAQDKCVHYFKNFEEYSRGSNFNLLHQYTTPAKKVVKKRGNLDKDDKKHF